MASSVRRGIGARLAVGPVVMAGLMAGLLAGLLAACGGSETATGNVYAVTPGTCFGPVEGHEVRDLPLVDCAIDHANEVFAVFEYDAIDAGEPADEGAAFPGDLILSEYSTSQCQQRLGEYVGTPYAQSDLEISSIYPTSASWAQADRQIICAAFSRDGEPLVGSVADAQI